MAYAFYLLGWLGVIAGGWLFAAASNAVSKVGAGGDQYTQAGAALGFLAVAGPAGGLFFAGLVLLGIGGALARLDTIAKSSRQMARAMRENLSVEPRLGT